MKPAKGILDRVFRYRPSHATDIRETFERVREELERSRAKRPPAEGADKVVQLRKAG